MHILTAMHMVLINDCSFMPTDLRSIYKVDAETRQTLSWEEPGVLPGEPVFVPRPNGHEEDDGVIIDIVLDIVKQNTFLLILDAKNFKEIGRAYAPFTIPIGLHGQFYSTQY